MLGVQPGPDTTSRMALLPRRSLVLLQDRVDELAYFLKLRTRTLRDFTLRRYRALQRLTHHPTVYSELLRHSLYRSYFVLVLATDLLEQSHFRTPFQPTLLSGFFPGSGYRSRWGGPNQMSEMGQFRLASEHSLLLTEPIHGVGAGGSQRFDEHSLFLPIVGKRMMQEVARGQPNGLAAFDNGADDVGSQEGITDCLAHAVRWDGRFRWQSAHRFCLL